MAGKEWKPGPGKVRIRGIHRGRGTHFIGHVVGSGGPPDCWKTGGSQTVVAHLRPHLVVIGIHVGSHGAGYRHPPDRYEKVSPHTRIGEVDAAFGGDDDWSYPLPSR